MRWVPMTYVAPLVDLTDKEREDIAAPILAEYISTVLEDYPDACEALENAYPFHREIAIQQWTVGLAPGMRELAQEIFHQFLAGSPNDMYVPNAYDEA